MPRSKAVEETDKLTRIAIVNSDKCKPKRCRQECKKYCPVVRMGKLCIQVDPNAKIAQISEELCIGCGICVKVCFASYYKPSSSVILVLIENCNYRNVHSKLSLSSIYPATWRKTPPIVIPKIHSNYTGFQFRDLVKYSVWLVPTESVNRQH